MLYLVSSWVHLIPKTKKMWTYVAAFMDSRFAASINSEQNFFSNMQAVSEVSIVLTFDSTSGLNFDLLGFLKCHLICWSSDCSFSWLRVMVRRIIWWLLLGSSWASCNELLANWQTEWWSLDLLSGQCNVKRSLDSYIYTWVWLGYCSEILP